LRTAIITGAAAGIGLATANLFARSGWRVLGADICQEPSAFEGYSFCCADLSDKKGINKLIEMAREFNGLDALVNNAALQVCKPLIETTLDDIDAVINLNLKVPLLLACKVCPMLKLNSGNIVNICSVHSLATSPGIGVYAASKAALLSLTRTMALEFGPSGIRANAVLPGAVVTDMLRNGISRYIDSGSTVEHYLDAIAEKQTLGRIGEPEEIAKLVLFLADNNQSSYITGQSVVADGGCLSRLSTE
jgi:NAD(P)-dependent dehydrogenase (short-subunit alcohol dehydrogenase family)